MVKVTLKLFKWVYFIIALVPLRWEFDEDSGRLNSFKFSFYYPETWWYLSMLVSQTIIVVMMTIKSWHDITDILTETGHDSVMCILVTAISYGTSTGMVFLPRLLILFRATRLRPTWKLIREIDSKLSAISEQSFKIEKRIRLGVVIIFILIILCTFFSSFFLLEQRYFKFQPYIVFQTILLFQFQAWLLLLHLSYYSVAFRIGQITTFLQENQIPSENSTQCDEQHQLIHHDQVAMPVLNQSNQTFERTWKMSKKLRIANSLFHQLVEVSQLLSSIFSLSILFLLTACFLVGTVELFFIIFSVSIEPMYGVDTSSLHLFSLILIIGIIFTILTTADLPVTELKNLRGLVSFLSTTTNDPEERLEILSFLTVLREDRVQLSAAGFFSVGMHLVPSLIGSMATYLVIILQTITDDFDQSASHRNASREMN